MTAPTRTPGRRAAAVTIAAMVIWLGASLSAHAADAIIAVATNFKETATRLQTEFERSTGHTLTLTAGSTGKLYAQIRNGAPFDILLAADQERPKHLEENGAAVAGTRMTYAIGRLTLWSADPDKIDSDGPALLRSGAFRRLAIANPDLAPYGAATMEILSSLKIQTAVQPKLVMGENVGQTYALVASGNAEIGFVALSYLLSTQNNAGGSRWDPPQKLYTPIYQDAVLLSRAANNQAAIAFLDYLKSRQARTLIATFGYGTDD